MENGRSRGWAVLVQAALDPSTPCTRTAKPLDLPFLVEFSVFLQKCTPYMLGHLPLTVRARVDLIVVAPGKKNFFHNSPKVLVGHGLKDYGVKNLFTM